MRHPVQDLSIDAEGLELIKSYEGLRLAPYVCSGGVLTVGYGHTGPDVFEGMEISEQQAAALLAGDLQRFEKAVKSMVRVPVFQGEYNALVSFVFNLGPGAFAGSTLLRKLNRRNYSGAASEFKRWCRAGGRVVEGLLSRRKSEERMFRDSLFVDYR